MAAQIFLDPGVNPAKHVSNIFGMHVMKVFHSFLAAEWAAGAEGAWVREWVPVVVLML
jgi:hypothetical protein